MDNLFSSSCFCTLFVRWISLSDTKDLIYEFKLLIILVVKGKDYKINDHRRFQMTKIFNDIVMIDEMVR